MVTQPSGVTNKVSVGEVWENARRDALSSESRPTLWKVEEVKVTFSPNCFSSDCPWFESRQILSADVRVNGQSAKLFFESVEELYRAGHNSPYNSRYYKVGLSGPNASQDTDYIVTGDASLFTCAFTVACGTPYERQEELEKALTGAGMNLNVVRDICECFSASMQLLTEDGRTVTFGELAALASAKLALPKIASIDETTGKVVYQQPTKVIDHGVSSDGILRGAGVLNGLEVTPNHPIYVQQADGTLAWKPAGDIASDDVAVNPFEGASFSIDASPITMQSVGGAYHLYDLSMPGDGDNAHNFWVKPPEGSQWVVAHNK